MYSDLFDQLGAASGAAGRNSNRESVPSEPEPLASFKAGKINMELKEASSNNTPAFSCTPDTARGEVRLVWKDNDLQWQWYDRRDKIVKNTIKVSDYTGSTFERIELPGKKHKTDRVYVWTKKQGEYEMYWMQDESEEKDDEIVASVNQYLADPKSAAPEGAADGMDTEPIGDSATGGASATSTDEAANQSQVDALSSILQNLGMPQSSSTAATPEGGQGTGTLTLADLQGAMAGIQTQPAPPGPPLADVITPEAITALLQDEGVKSRLLELLPEEQRSETFLEENLRSPQIQQTLRSLTQAILPDDTGDMSGFYSVIANFSLDPADGHDGLAANNPIQAFLDCILKSVEKSSSEESKEEESKEE